MTAATTGLTEADASVSAIDYEKSFTNSSSHAGFYPSAVDMTIKLIFEKNTGKILGAQIVGYEGADKRIDVITTAIRLGATADDLTNLDLAYSAPYSTPKDPVNIAGSVAQNILTGKVKVFHWHDVAKLPKDGSVSLLDVRSKLEYANGTIEGFKNISLGHIRKSLGEIDKTKPVYITCQTGHRGYIASRILTGNGYDCYNLSGGHKLYESITSAPTATLATPAPNTSPVIPAKAGISAPTATPVPATNTPSPVIASEAKQSSVPAAAQREASITKTGKVIQVNAEGLQCPGPIIKLSAALKDIETGDTIEISATDAAFPGDAESFCRRTGNEFQGVISKGGVSVATITKGTAPAPGASGTPGALYASNANGKNFIVFSGDLDKAIASFIMANASAALGRDVSMFFTFWGLNLLRRPEKVPVKKSFIPKMFAAMMPRGSRKLPLSKMNFGGMGAKMIRKVMNDNNISSLEDLMSTARENGVKFVACGMSMDVMGITEAELIEGVTIGGAASMLAHAEESDMSLFI
jgi:peroxiredoxin family protein/rhodanese-related sulfurtransferase/TusA-related sulfurtransferase